MEEIKGLKSNIQLAVQVAGLPSEWNHLEVVLKDLEQDRRISEGKQSDGYIKATYAYELSRARFYAHGGEAGVQAAETSSRNDPVLSLDVYNNGGIKIGDIFRPLEIKFVIDGHSHLHEGDAEYYGNYFSLIKNQIMNLFSKDYSIIKLKGLRNQRDNFPGNIDADAVIELYLDNEESL